MVYALDVLYCQVCRIGTIDQQGLCRLCGAPQRPPSRLGRLAEAAGNLLNVLLQPAVLAVAGLAAVLLLAAVVQLPGVQAPAGVPRVGFGALSDPQANLASARTDPVGAAVRFLLPAVVQGLLFFLLILGLIALVRFLRRSERRERQATG
jgi:hypothetical protein